MILRGVLALAGHGSSITTPAATDAGRAAARAYLQSGLTILWEPGDLLLGPVPARQVRQ
jgi:hypothetical protein